MKHLSVDKIIDFVSCTGLDDDEITLVKEVNEHIRRCPRCLKLVQAFQIVYDEFESLCVQDDFREYVYCNAAELTEKDMEQDGYANL